MCDENIKMQDPERMAYLQIIDKLLKLINPEKIIELERLEVDKHMAMMQQIQMHKRHMLDYELATTTTKQPQEE
jgi:hypothetical protein